MSLFLGGKKKHMDEGRRKVLTTTTGRPKNGHTYYNS